MWFPSFHYTFQNFPFLNCSIIHLFILQFSLILFISSMLLFFSFLSFSSAVFLYLLLHSSFLFRSLFLLSPLHNPASLSFLFIQSWSSAVLLHLLFLLLLLSPALFLFFMRSPFSFVWRLWSCISFPSVPCSILSSLHLPLALPFSVHLFLPVHSVSFLPRLLFLSSLWRF